MLLRRLAATASAPSSRFSLPPTIRQILARPSPTEEPATISGWIKSIRKQKNVSFAVITDGSSAEGLQAVLTKGKDDELLRKLTNGAAVRFTGRLVKSPGAGQSIELLVDQSREGKIQLLGECPPETYPIQKKDLTTEYLRDHVHLRARTSRIAAMLRLRDGLKREMDNWFEAQGFYFCNTPIITGNDAEGAGETFRLEKIQASHPAIASPQEVTPPSEFFSRPAFLTVSHQLHLEALATAISRVYTLSPCFRAERSLTSRHLAEFWMLEAEWVLPDGDGVQGICDLTEGLLKDTVGAVIGNQDMDLLWKDREGSMRQALLDAVQSHQPWARMTYTDAIMELEKAHFSAPFEYEPKWGRSLKSEHERWLAEKLICGPVFVTDYPAALKPFYMRANDDERTVACLDLLVPYTAEIVGGSVREERLDVLQQKMGDHGENDAWYLDLRKYGGAPHAGFGMGFERLISWITGIENIRECIPMPRWTGRMLL
ncbi:hypothetical protein CVT26_009816 [Gymnopilus dilepis]|uniref:asparagine--tRNA ligase n=1 Tax=Gymnopilus dilepis TaxID=231916 RepID=A0A409VKY9_9AGAR|nr:hypothetical protein CVT26_009816 [Gymnopilus dilepis]